MSRGRRGPAQQGGRTENTGPGASEGQVCDSTQAITENSASPLSARLWSMTNGTCAENTGLKLHSLPLSSMGEPDLVSLFLLAHGEEGALLGPCGCTQDTTHTHQEPRPCSSLPQQLLQQPGPARLPALWLPKISRLQVLHGLFMKAAELSPWEPIG